MTELSEPIKLIIAFLIGAVIGLERENADDRLTDSKKSPYAPFGLRTGSLIAGLGAISGLLFTDFMAISITIAAAYSVLLIVYYILNVRITKDIGTTTEIALLYVFVIGFLIASEAIAIQLTIAMSVILMLILSRKQEIKSVIRGVDKREINALVSYGLISLVILPFLPNTAISLSDIPFISQYAQNVGEVGQELLQVELINPFKLWLIVTLITGLDIVGHVLERVVGQKRGWLLTSAVGGFVSSTATTLALAQQSKGVKKVNHLVSAAVLSNLTSFFQIAILILTLNAVLFVESLPILLAIIIAGSVLTGYFQFRKEGKGSNKLEKSKNVKEKGDIINLWPALRFAILFVIINLVSKVSIILFGNAGFLLTTAIGALPGIDAVIINAAELAGNQISYQLAALGIVVANAVNLLSKSVYSYIQGERKFAHNFFISMLIIIAASIVGWGITFL